MASWQPLVQSFSSSRSTAYNYGSSALSYSRPMFGLAMPWVLAAILGVSQLVASARLFLVLATGTTLAVVVPILSSMSTNGSRPR